MLYTGTILNDKYRIIKKINEGGHSTIWLCRSDGINLVIKMYNRKQRKVAINETDILRDLEHKNIIKCYDHFDYYYCKMLMGYRLKCIVFEECDTDLYDYMRAHTYKNEPLHIKKLLLDFMSGLAFLHTSDIIHYDLKLENILIKDGIAKIADFGSACKSYMRPGEYIGTQDYESPELLLDMICDKKSDIWSAGCIIYEVVTGDELFSSHSQKYVNANASADNLCQMIGLLGPAPYPFIEIKKYQRYARFRTKHAESIRHRIALSKVTDPNFIDLICKMISWSPESRLTADQCLHHPWFSAS